MSASVPTTVCPACVASARRAVPFIQLSLASQRKWQQITNYLSNMEVGQRDSVCVVIGDDIKLIDYTKRTKTLSTKKQVLRVLKSKMNQHKIGPSIPSHLKCPECGKKHTTVFELNKHIKDLKMKMCIYCKSMLPTETFPDHVRIAHNAMVYACETCKKIFRMKKRYDAHKLVCGKKVSKGRYVCCMCKKGFPSEINLVVHCSSKHNPQVCRGCDKKFISWHCYTYHLKRCSSSKPVREKFICDYCSKEYRFKSALKLHIRSTHTVGWLLQCEDCGKRFSNPAHLKEHGNTHNKVADRYVCKICNSKYSTRRGYERHFKRHFDEQGKSIEYVPRRRIRKKTIYMCGICSSAFDSKKTLIRHLERKHDIFDWEDQSIN